MVSVEHKAAVASGRTVWNVISAVFNPASVQIAALPELKPVLDVLRSIADAATRGRSVLVKAIADAQLDASTLTPDQLAKANALSSQITALLKAYEKDSGLFVLALPLERSANGVSVGQVTVT